MPYRKRPRIEPTEDWAQLRLQLAWPEQVSYELIRPVVLFGWSPAERAKQTDIPERTLRREVDRFDAEGMASLFEPNRPLLNSPSYGQEPVWALRGRSASAL